MADNTGAETNGSPAALYQRHEAAQLARIADGAFRYLGDRADEQAQLCRRIGQALVDAGFTLYDRVAERPLGGAMLMPLTDPQAGVYAGWTVPDPLEHDDHRQALCAYVAKVMNDAIATVLRAYGFDIGDHDHPMLITRGPDPQRALRDT